jgi:hypothetical protein
MSGQNAYHMTLSIFLEEANILSSEKKLKQK